MNEEQIRSDLEILRSADYAAASEAARNVSFEMHDQYFRAQEPSADEGPILDAALGRLALQTHCVLRAAGLVDLDLNGEAPERLGYGAPLPNDNRLKAYATALVEGNFVRPREPASRVRRRRPGALVR